LKEQKIYNLEIYDFLISRISQAVRKSGSQAVRQSSS